jgi:hypothetical protein
MENLTADQRHAIVARIREAARAARELRVDNVPCNEYINPNGSTTEEHRRPPINR